MRDIGSIVAPRITIFGMVLPIFSGAARIQQAAAYSMPLAFTNAKDYSRCWAMFWNRGLLWGKKASPAICRKSRVCLVLLKFTEVWGLGRENPDSVSGKLVIFTCLYSMEFVDVANSRLTSGEHHAVFSHTLRLLVEKPIMKHDQAWLGKNLPDNFPAIKCYTPAFRAGIMQFPGQSGIKTRLWNIWPWASGNFSISISIHIYIYVYVYIYIYTQHITHMLHGAGIFTCKTGWFCSGTCS